MCYDNSSIREVLSYILCKCNNGIYYTVFRFSTVIITATDKDIRGVESESFIDFTRKFLKRFQEGLVVVTNKTCTIFGFDFVALLVVIVGAVSTATATTSTASFGILFKTEISSKSRSPTTVVKVIHICKHNDVTFAEFSRCDLSVFDIVFPNSVICQFRVGDSTVSKLFSSNRTVFDICIHFTIVTYSILFAVFIGNDVLNQFTVLISHRLFVGHLVVLNKMFTGTATWALDSLTIVVVFEGVHEHDEIAKLRRAVKEAKQDGAVSQCFNHFLVGQVSLIVVVVFITFYVFVVNRNKPVLDFLCVDGIIIDVGRHDFRQTSVICHVVKDICDSLFNVEFIKVGRNIMLKFDVQTFQFTELFIICFGYRNKLIDIPHDIGQKVVVRKRIIVQSRECLLTPKSEIRNTVNMSVSHTVHMARKFTNRHNFNPLSRITSIIRRISPNIRR